MLAAGPAGSVSARLAGVAAPTTAAATLYGPPAILLAVNTGAVATPSELVVAVLTPPAKEPLGPLVGAVKVTVTPLTGLFPESFTVACNCVVYAVLTVALCGVPPVAVILAAAPVRLVSEKFAGVATPDTVAETAYGPPPTLFAVKTAHVATPDALVVAVFTPPANVPLAPLVGAVNVFFSMIRRPPRSSLFPSSTLFRSAVLTVALCGVPPVAVMLAAAPVRFVSEKLAGMETP